MAPDAQESNSHADSTQRPWRKLRLLTAPLRLAGHPHPRPSPAPVPIARNPHEGLRFAQ